MLTSSKINDKGGKPSGKKKKKNDEVKNGFNALEKKQFR